MGLKDLLVVHDMKSITSIILNEKEFPHDVMKLH
jgi:hypothetical protein